LNSSPRLAASVEDLLFLGNFCERNAATQTFTLADPGGANVPFTITSSNPGVHVTPSSGTTPATISVTVDPNAFTSQKGTAAVQLTFSSNVALNIPKSVRVLVNSREPAQRGTIIDIPGTLVDMISDPSKDQFYVLRQDMNQLLVFDGTNNTLKTTLRTCTKPTSMAVTWDQLSLIVGCDNSHMMRVYDIPTLTLRSMVYAPTSYVQSLGVSSKVVLAVMRDGGGGSPNIQRVDLGGANLFGTVIGTTYTYTQLGVWQNKVPLNSVLAGSPNGSTILVASSDGSVFLYDANQDTFTISRKDFPSFSGPYAASSFNQYVIGNQIFDSSLVQTATIQGTSGTPSGFAFVDQGGIFSAAPTASDPGVIERVDTTFGTGINPTGTVEAPLLNAAPNLFTRTLAPIFSRSEIVELTTSGVVILPWTYDAAVLVPNITRVVSAADGFSPVAPGGLMSVLGTNMSPTNIATGELPLPTALANSCLTVNGGPIPIMFVSGTQLNAQMPFEALGNVTMVWHTPGGVSNNFNFTVLPNAPAIFHSATAGDQSNLPTVVRFTNGLLVTDTNPVHRNDILTIYLTGLGAVAPAVNDGFPGPFGPLATTISDPVVQLGGVGLQLLYSGLAPGEVGVYVLNVIVPSNAPQGLSVPLTIAQGGSTYTLNVRVVQ